MYEKVFLIFLGLILIFIGFEKPMTFIFPLWIFTYLFKEKLTKISEIIPKNYRFLVLGILFGLLLETFAIMQNWSLPDEQKILISPDPLLDLIYGFFYYFLLIAAWFFLLKRTSYSKKDVFILTGIYGIFTEEIGQVFLRIFEVPLYGLLYALLIATIYGIFPMLAYLLTEKNFEGTRRKVRKRSYFFALLLLFLQWVIYGSLVLPLLKSLFT